MRFNEMLRSINGVSHRMLTLTLRGLERDGLATRKVFPTIPPKVEYQLSPLGKSLTEPIGALMGWAQTHQSKINAARKAFDERKEFEEALAVELRGEPARVGACAIWVGEVGSAGHGAARRRPGHPWSVLQPV